MLYTWMNFSMHCRVQVIIIVQLSLENLINEKMWLETFISYLKWTRIDDYMAQETAKILTKAICPKS